MTQSPYITPAPPTLGAALDALDALYAPNTDADSERVVTAIISAARDGIIAAYQQGLDLDAARVAVCECARVLVLNIAQITTPRRGARREQDIG